jgi:predicted metallopeptidase
LRLVTGRHWRGGSRPTQWRSEAYRVANLIEEAINCDDRERAARIILDALGIETLDVANYCIPKSWPKDHNARARIIGDWLQAEALFLAPMI